MDDKKPDNLPEELDSSTPEYPIDLSSADLLPLAQEQQNRVLGELVQAESLDDIKDLTHLFNASQTKRNALRIQALNDVQDALVRQMASRLQSQPDNFNNADIATWMKTVQQVMDTSQKSVDQVDVLPTIVRQQNNTQVNVNIGDSLSRESRERVVEAVQKILQSVQNIEPEPVYTEESTSPDVETLENSSVEEIGDSDSPRSS